MYKLRRNASDVIYTGDWKPTYDEEQRGWRISPMAIFPDSGREFVLTQTLIPVIEFKLRYDAQDRIYLETLKDTDSIIKDLFNLLDDARTLAVDIGNSTVEYGTAYALDKCRLHFSYTEQEVAERLVRILAEKVEA